MTTLTWTTSLSVFHVMVRAQQAVSACPADLARHKLYHVDVSTAYGSRMCMQSVTCKIPDLTSCGELPRAA